MKLVEVTAAMIDEIHTKYGPDGEQITEEEATTMYNAIRSSIAMTQVQAMVIESVAAGKVSMAGGIATLLAYAVRIGFYIHQDKSLATAEVDVLERMFKL